MVLQTFTTRGIDRRQKKVVCADCGASADIVLIADQEDQSTGHRDELALCKACFQKREQA